MSHPTIPVAVLGATGTVGRHYISLLSGHPWFNVVCVAASARSAGKTYGRIYAQSGDHSNHIPDQIKSLVIKDADKDIKSIAEQARLVFSALSMKKEDVQKLEEAYASAECAVVSNNSAHRWTPDVPMIIPEVNPNHTDIIPYQRKRRGWNAGLIAVKSNCSIQSYVPVIDAWKQFEPEQIIAATYQAVSGAGKTLEQWPEMQDNVIPFIQGEEEKSELEPLKVWGSIKNGLIVNAEKPVISSTCVRVPVSNGHLAVIHVKFRKKPEKKQLVYALENYINPIENLNLPGSPEKFLIYFEEENRPQTKLDRNCGNGMSITAGRLRKDNVLDWKFTALSHNTVRGAAGGAILLAELLYKKGFIMD